MSSLSRFRSATPSLNLVVLLDGLDRVQDVDALAPVLVMGARELQAASIGVLVVGPQQLRYRHHKGFLETLTGVHFHGALDTSEPPTCHFLEEVLKRRADDELLPASTRSELVKMSGGVVRDLLALARDAGEEAYALGASSVLPEHVASAADRFGRGRLLGIRRDEARRLLEIRGYGSRPNPMKFTLAVDEDVALLLAGVLLEVSSTPPQYIIHPTVEPLLSALRQSA